MAYLKTKDNQTVRINMEHLQQHRNVLFHLMDALMKIDTCNQKFIRIAVDLGRPLGRSDCVATNESDEIVYAQRKGRPILSRFVKNRVGGPCSLVTVIMVKKGNVYQLLTAYIGDLAEREPSDSSIRTKSDYEASVAFWKHHALTLEGSEIVGPVSKDSSVYYKNYF